MLFQLLWKDGLCVHVAWLGNHGAFVPGDSPFLGTGQSSPRHVVSTWFVKDMSWEALRSPLCLTGVIWHARKRDGGVVGWWGYHWLSPARDLWEWYVVVSTYTYKLVMRLTRPDVL